MTTNKKVTGYELYAGPSYGNRGGIVVIATGIGSPSTNVKTGAMVQLYILSSEEKPTTASTLALDVANCGDCKHRHSKGGACYVNLGHGPNMVYKSWKRGVYPKTKDYSFLSDRKVRLGAYGDISAIPTKPLKAILSCVNEHTGYTHGWQKLKGERKELIQAYSVASVDSKLEQLEAHAKGWNTFRVMPKGKSPLDSPKNRFELKQIECLNVTLGTQCIDCMLCSGNHSRRKVKRSLYRQRHIFIGAHGSRASKFDV